MTTNRHWIYHFGVRTTNDGSGRLVIPKRRSEQFHFSDGATIEIVAESDGLLLRLPRTESFLVETGGVLVQQADKMAPVDATTFINEQREARSLQGVPNERAS